MKDRGIAFGAATGAATVGGWYAFGILGALAGILLVALLSAILRG